MARASSGATPKSQPRSPRKHRVEIGNDERPGGFCSGPRCADGKTVFDGVLSSINGAEISRTDVVSPPGSSLRFASSAETPKCHSRSPLPKKSWVGIGKIEEAWGCLLGTVAASLVCQWPPTRTIVGGDMSGLSRGVGITSDLGSSSIAMELPRIKNEASSPKADDEQRFNFELILL